jgi:hypothetical protein
VSRPLLLGAGRGGAGRGEAAWVIVPAREAAVPERPCNRRTPFLRVVPQLADVVSPLSAGGQEPAQDPHTESERVDGDPLVDSVEHAGEVEVGGQPQRGEPVPGDPQVAE